LLQVTGGDAKPITCKAACGALLLLLLLLLLLILLLLAAAVLLLVVVLHRWSPAPLPLLLVRNPKNVK
jgi:hypothetical protein